jgi:hypothetical protein
MLMAAARMNSRRTPRVTLDVPVSVQYGHLRVQVGSTLDVSRSGALILCGSELSEGTIIALKNLVNQASTSALIVRSAGRHPSGQHRLGILFVEENARMWQPWLGEGAPGDRASD